MLSYTGMRPDDTELQRRLWTIERVIRGAPGRADLGW